MWHIRRHHHRGRGWGPRGHERFCMCIKQTNARGFVPSSMLRIVIGTHFVCKDFEEFSGSKSYFHDHQFSIIDLVDFG